MSSRDVAVARDTADARKMDAADGKMDGKYYDKDIYVQRDAYAAHVSACMFVIRRHKENCVSLKLGQMMILGTSVHLRCLLPTV